MLINGIDTLEMTGKASREAKLDYHRPGWWRDTQDGRQPTSDKRQAWSDERDDDGDGGEQSEANEKQPSKHARPIQREIFRKNDRQLLVRH